MASIVYYHSSQGLGKWSHADFCPSPKENSNSTFCMGILMEDLIGTSFDNLPRQQASKAIWSVELRAISCIGAASICLALRKEEGGLRFSLGLWV